MKDESRRVRCMVKAKAQVSGSFSVQRLRTCHLRPAKTLTISGTG